MGPCVRRDDPLRACANINAQSLIIRRKVCDPRPHLKE
jgi:hypothetical protein